MQNNQTSTRKRARGFFGKLVSCLMLVAILVQTLALSCAAVADEVSPLFSGIGSGNKGNGASGIGKFDSDEVIKQLKEDFIASLNKDLVQRIDDSELKGEVGVIISFSDTSIIDEFSSSSASDYMTYEEYLGSSAAIKLKNKLASNQSGVLTALEEAGLIGETKYNYYNIMDGAYVRTTYENIEAICSFEGVERVMISNAYLPAVAVDNPVYVYETGIFNSSDIEFTGKGTIVAVLDTGCDYTHSAFTTHDVVDPLYDRSDIEALMKDLKAYEFDTSIEARELYYGNLTKNKIAYGYDYADKDTDIMPFRSSHGTHVAGIIGGYDSEITGVALDTQFAIMKVFSDYKDGGEDGDILAALEDSVVLGVDAINMSLGTSCGFSREVDDEYKNEIYDRIEAAGISLIVAASNDYSSGFGSEQGNTNKTDNPDSATVGAPSTYSASLSVASINGNKENYMFVNGDREVFFNEAYNMSAKLYDFFDMLGVNEENPHAEFEYVTVPGLGYAINYAGLDLEGKIALVKRGDITFEEKVQFAKEANAAAVIIYNNVFGEISMTVGNHLNIPVISIGKDDGEAMAAFETGKVVFDYSNEAGPFMSDFSSWGPTPDLKLKPEVTAHGGNIYSAIPGGEYEELSGTSMAAPNMCGIAVLIRQYVKEKYPEFSTTEVRDLVNELCMSTATIALDKKGNPYSPRKQGAGIADIVKSTTTPAYLYVLNEDGTKLGKTKLELGDDPTRSGVYEMTINLENISDKSVSYKLGNIAMTESVSTSDPEYVAEMAYMLSNTAEYKAEGGTLEGGVLTVEAGKTAKVTAKITLSAADKAYINESFENGMFVEGYLTFDNTEEKGVDLNAPFLAFFGDWGEAHIFDLDYYEEETEKHNNAIDEDDKIKADYYATTPLGLYYYDYIIPLGAYLYEVDESEYSVIPGTREHAAVSYFNDAISGIYGVYAGLLRGAKELKTTIVDTATGEVVWENTEYNCYKSHYGGAPLPYYSRFDIPMVDYATNEIFGSNNSHYEVTMSAVLDWDSENRNSLDTYSFSFYIDYEAPTVTDAKFYTKYDKSKEEDRYYVDIYVYDNHYAMSLRPIAVYEIMERGEMKKTYSSLCDYPIPIYQENRGEVTKVTLEITDYLDAIAASGDPEGLTIHIDDYAMNSGIAYIPFPETDSTDIKFKSEEITLDINETFDLAEYFVREGSEEAVDGDYLNALTWTSSDESVVAISGGKIEALKAGSAVIEVTGNSWKTKNGLGDTVPLSKKIAVKVTENEVKNPESSGEVKIEALDFVSYNTLFAFNSDIDFSEIGRTDSINYFGKKCEISFYPSEQIQLNYNLKPWNLPEDRYTLTWKSSNPKVATVDENGVVTAEAEGTANISLQIAVDGKTSLLAARCSVEVKSEFVIENRTLIAYKGKGGDVIIPDDEGVLYIGEYAFCHYDFVHDREVEKDENGYYDVDEKRDALGNDTVTSVVIPEGVDTINQYAFYNCENLSSVTLPESCKTIGEYAFANCGLLVDVNFENVNTIYDYAFYQCTSLTCEGIGVPDLSGVYAIGKYTFAGARFSDIKLTTLSLAGIGAFMDCSKLTSVELGTKTRVSEKMFENTPLESIVIYSDIISDSAFKNCTELKSVEIKNDITYLGAEAFSGCAKLEDVVFDGGCEAIANNAFYECSALESFTLPDCDVTIGDAAFGSSGLKTLVFAENSFITSGGVSIFDKVGSVTLDASASAKYKLDNKALFTKDGKTLVLLTPGASVSSFTVGAAVTKIADGAFSSNTSLTTVTFEGNSALESIGASAFANCTKLSNITLPASVKSIGRAAFFGNTSLQSIDLSNVTYVGELAFAESALTSVNIGAESVVIGDYAFSDAKSLKTVTLGAKAVIGKYAFANDTALTTVTILGEGATVSEGAFAFCSKLSSFDFEDVSGALGKGAFINCSSLTAVNIPNVTEIGEACFSTCTSLTTVTAPKLEKVGNYAFAPYSDTSARAATLTSIDAPKLREIGIYGFRGCEKLKKIDISGVAVMGEAAFADCTALTTVTLGEDLKEIPKYAFYNDKVLSSINLDKVVTFGQSCVYNTKLPAEIDLSSAEFIGNQAFAEPEGKNNIEKVIAPNLKTADDYAFIGCAKLKEIYAPKLETVGLAAFAYTAIEKFEITSSLKVVGDGAFEGCESLTAFFTKEENTEIYTKDLGGVMLKDGVLYLVTEKGYVLVRYPIAKTDKEFKVEEGTVRIDFGAVHGNTSLEKVILPGSLTHIGNYAFFGCENLKTVVFNSYYAPTLEATFTGEIPEISSSTVSQYPGFDKLYKYNYYYMKDDIVTPPYNYRNFVDTVTSEAAEGLTYVIPTNSFGYDSAIYGAYFKASETENSGTVMGPYAISFIEAVRKLPETADRFDKSLIDAAINAYNALVEKKDEMAFVDESYVEKYNKACSQYNVSVAENKIAHLFDIANSEYFFNKVKDAREFYLGLSDADKALVKNASVLDTKIEALKNAMGVEPDFSLNYSDHFAEEPTEPDVPDDPNGSDNGGNLVTAVIIVAVSVVVLAAAAVVVIVFLKKKKGSVQ
ncbi:MAG: leucine-rich repeat protein [Clostridia bacterium]|nr:leucine-rich repeat protein [Clostridia bacterium]